MSSYHKTRARENAAPDLIPVQPMQPMGMEEDGVRTETNKVLKLTSFNRGNPTQLGYAKIPVVEYTTTNIDASDCLCPKRHVLEISKDLSCLDPAVKKISDNGYKTEHVMVIRAGQSHHPSLSHHSPDYKLPTLYSELHQMQEEDVQIASATTKTRGIELLTEPIVAAPRPTIWEPFNVDSRDAMPDAVRH